MTSFRISVPPSRREATRLIATIRNKLQKIVVEEKEASGITQSDVARAIGVHRSVINRELRGKKDLTIGRLGELAWAYGRTVHITFPKQAIDDGDNAQPVTPGALQEVSDGLRSEMEKGGGQKIEEDAPRRPTSSKMLNEAPRQRSHIIEKREYA